MGSHILGICVVLMGLATRFQTQGKSVSARLAELKELYPVTGGGEGPELWVPAEGRALWFQCNGLPCDQWHRIVTKLNYLRHVEGLEMAGTFPSDPNTAAEGDFWYTEAQVDFFVNQIDKHTGAVPPLFGYNYSTESAPNPLPPQEIPEQLAPTYFPEFPADWPVGKKLASLQSALKSMGEKQGIKEGKKSKLLYTLLAIALLENGDKEKVGEIAKNEKHGHLRDAKEMMDFSKKPTYKWHNPIIYKFDGTHTTDEQQIIKRAFEHWEKYTCIRFFQVNRNAPIPQDHLLLTSQGKGCYSFVGHVGRSPQQINLESRCMQQFGTPVHEIGHALGMFHEQQRADRDEYITLFSDRIAFYRSQYYKEPTASHGVPYDFSSIMQYVWNAGSLDGNPTMEPKDPQYLLTMGQRVALSYLDAKIVNRAYCSAECSSRPLVKPCRRGGYQDPNHCSRCMCPDGFGGQFCQEVAPSTQACGGSKKVGRAPSFIETPGYNSHGYYADNTECVWHLQVPKQYVVRLEFQGAFGVYMKDATTCFHWVEIKLSTTWDYPGPRFCGSTTPTGAVTSHTEEMVVIFRSNYPTLQQQNRRGFLAKVFAVPGPRVGPPILPFPVIIQGDPTVPPDTSGTSWGAWGPCSDHHCKCGGCSYRTRYRMCGPRRCNEPKAGAEVLPCDKVCTAFDTYFDFSTGMVIDTRCPTCCRDYKQKGSQCVLNY